jgi:putative ABC transport system permease protein
MKSFAVRSIIMGAGAGMIALIIAGIASYGVIELWMDNKYYFDFSSGFLIVCLGILTNSFTGLIFSFKPLSSKPAKILKTED